MYVANVEVGMFFSGKACHAQVFALIFDLLKEKMASLILKIEHEG